MILKALYDYYQRNQVNLAPQNMSYEEFHYAIIIDKDGNFIRIDELCNEDGSGKEILTLRPEERTSSPVPHYLGDNGSYVLGLKNVKIKDGFDYHKEFKDNMKNHESFVNYIDHLHSLAPEDVLINAIQNFYKQDLCRLYEQQHNLPSWKRIASNLNKNFTFQINGSHEVAAEYEPLFQMVLNEKGNKNHEQICLITGQKAKPVTNTCSTFVLGGKSNAKLVSFQTSSGYDSYGKKSCLNSPISEEAEFKYTTALLYLLRKGSHNKFTIGKDNSTRTFIFWASSDSLAAKASEDSLFAFFGKVDDDDPNRRIELVKQTFMSIYNGKLASKKDDKFYILGLAPNAARIAVVYWAEIPLCDFAHTISRHFEDMELEDTRKEKFPYMGLHSILGAVTRGGKSSDATPNLPDAVVKSIFQGLPYPTSLFQSCIRRIRAEQTLTIDRAKQKARAAILKAYLNRLNDNNTKIKIMLDKENANQGYLCGRLFAVLENLQYAANKQDSIRSSYMNAASSTPAAVFSTILKLSNSHYGKLAKDKKGLAIYFDAQKEEIMAMLEDFPETLALQDQGRFFLGYYHQKNYKENKETEE